MTAVTILYDIYSNGTKESHLSTRNFSQYASHKKAQDRSMIDGDETGDTLRRKRHVEWRSVTGEDRVSNLSCTRGSHVLERSVERLERPKRVVKQKPCRNAAALNRKPFCRPNPVYV
jgi:hypothetical protein